MEMGDMPFAVDKGAYEESVGIRPENWSNRNERHHESRHLTEVITGRSLRKHRHSVTEHQASEATE